MYRENENDIAWGIAAAVGLFALLVWQLSIKWHVDFETLLEAIISSALSIGAVAYIYFALGINSAMMVALCIAFVWINWFPVIQSIAAGGDKPDMIDPNFRWWTSPTLEWTVAVIIVGIGAFLSRNRRYYF